MTTSGQSVTFKDRYSLVESLRHDAAFDARKVLGAMSSDSQVGWKRRFSDAALFARNFILHPQMLGSFLPSSSFLVRDILADVEWDRARVIVEYGPGTGPVTQEILRRMRTDARLFAIELNTEFVDRLKASTRDPRFTVFNGSATDVRSLISQNGTTQADYVISGIPFTAIPHPVRRSIVCATREILRPDGEFIVYQLRSVVLPHLQANFGSIEKRIQWLNLLPIRIYRCRTPREASRMSTEAGVQASGIEQEK